MITKPLLPPKAGYVEVIDSNGNHVYKKVETPESKQLDALTSQLSMMTEYIAALEDALCEIDASHAALAASVSAE